MGGMVRQGIQKNELIMGYQTLFHPNVGSGSSTGNKMFAFLESKLFGPNDAYKAIIPASRPFGVEVFRQGITGF
jgi:hypothetical protein